MCGRFVQATSPELLARRFSAVDTIGSDHAPSYNVAPSTPIPVIIEADGRRLGRLQWGFVPSWAEDPDRGPRPINARAEGVATSRLFGPALARRRCIVPVDAWYEWSDERGARQPWLLTPGTTGHDDGTPVAIAALWSTWRGTSPGTSDGPARSTVALITTAATGPAAQVHHRMPLVVPDERIDDWLDPSRTRPQELLSDLTDRVTPVRVTRVSRRVNDVRNDDATLLEAMEEHR